MCRVTLGALVPEEAGEQRGKGGLPGSMPLTYFCEGGSGGWLEIPPALSPPVGLLKARSLLDNRWNKRLSSLDGQMRRSEGLSGIWAGFDVE